MSSFFYQIIVQPIKSYENKINIDHCIFSRCIYSENQRDGIIILKNTLFAKLLTISNSLFYNLHYSYLTKSNAIVIYSQASKNYLLRNCYDFISGNSPLISAPDLILNYTSFSGCNTQTSLINIRNQKVQDCSSNNHTRISCLINYIGSSYVLDYYMHSSLFERSTISTFNGLSIVMKYLNIISCKFERFRAQSISNSVVLNTVINQFNISTAPVDVVTDNENFTLFIYEKNPVEITLDLNALEKFVIFTKNVSEKSSFVADIMRFPDFFEDVIVDNCIFQKLETTANVILVGNKMLSKFTLQECRFNDIYAYEEELIYLELTTKKNTDVVVTKNCFSDIYTRSLIYVLNDDYSDFLFSKSSICLLFPGSDASSSVGIDIPFHGTNDIIKETKNTNIGLNSSDSSLERIIQTYNTIFSYSCFSNLSGYCLISLFSSKIENCNFIMCNSSNSLQFHNSNIAESVFYNCSIETSENFIDCRLYFMNETPVYVDLSYYLDDFCLNVNSYKKRNITLIIIAVSVTVGIIIIAISSYLIYLKTVNKKLEKRINLSLSLINDFG